jgi:hypothetical protein
MLDAAIRALAAQLGITGLGLDTSDEHQRWELYKEAIDRRTGWDRLLKCVGSEPDAAVATTVVAQVMEMVDAELRKTWVDALPEEGRPFGLQRLREFAILDDPESAKSPQGGWNVAGWSDWLQLRLAEGTSHLGVLSELASVGRTKRIRRVAGERIALLRGSS